MANQAISRQPTNITEEFSYNPASPSYTSREYRQFQGVRRNTDYEVLIFEYAHCNKGLEALIQANHPHFLTVLAWAIDPVQKSLLVVFEFPGALLSTVFKQRAYMRHQYTEDELISLLGMVLSVLLYAQKHGFYHSRLTLDKVYVTEDMEVKLWDWEERPHMEELTEPATCDTSIVSETKWEPWKANLEEMVQIIKQLTQSMTTQEPFSPEFRHMMQLISPQTSDSLSLEAVFSQFLSLFPATSARLGFSNSGCSECKRSNPAFMCSCNSVPLCGACRPLHSLEMPSNHFIVSREQWERLCCTENSDQICVQIGIFNTILEGLTTAIDALAVQMKATTDYFDKYMQSITTEKTKRLKMLDNFLKQTTELRNLIEKAGEKEVWKEPSDLLMRLWQVPRPYFTVETNDWGSFQPREYLFSLEGELRPAIYFYSPGIGIALKRIDVDERLQYISLDSKIHIDEDTTLAYCYSSKLALCGSMKDPHQFLQIEATSGLIEAAVKTLFPRHRAGIVAVSSYVYVFGGREIGPLAEVVSLERAATMQIADMYEANTLFNPCATSQGLIYLPGRFVTEYNTQTHSYQKLFTLSFLFTTATAVCVSNSLYIFTNEGLVTFDLQRKGPIRKSDLHTVGFCSNPAPKLVAQQAYFCSAGESVVLCFSFSNTGVSQHQLSLA